MSSALALPGSIASSAPPKKKNASKSVEDDIDIIHRVPGTRTFNAKCGNMKCYARNSDTKLKACARCKIVMYCSRECQVANWPAHKQVCRNNIEHIAELSAADQSGEFQDEVPGGLTLVELDQKLEKWVKYHNSLLMAATIHAMGLPRSIKRASEYLLRVKVTYRTDNNGLTAKLFRVEDAFLIDIESARAKGGVWSASIEQVEKVRKESEAARRGTVAAIALECEPLAMQIVPFGSLRDLGPLRIQEKWKDILIRDIEAGKRFTRFE